MSEEKKLNGTVIVTYRCNARCSMCNRYKAPSKPEEEISIETIKKLPKMYFTMGGWGIWETVNGEQKLTTECIENVIMMVPFSAVVMWTFEDKIGNGWKKILCYSGKIAFIFSVSIEMLQLLLRLGTFQLSDIFYNTVGGLLGGLMYCAVMKARKRL